MMQVMIDDDGDDDNDDNYYNYHYGNKISFHESIHLSFSLIEKEEIPSKSKQVVASDQMNIKGVYLHVLGDALGSVIVVCSALAIYYGSGSWTLYVDPGMR